MCFKRPPHPSQLNIPVSLPVKDRVVCLQQEVSKSLGLLAAAHSVCFHRPLVLRRKNSGMPSPPADPSASHTCPVTGNRPFFFFQIELSGYQTLVYYPAHLCGSLFCCETIRPSPVESAGDRSHCQVKIWAYG